MAGAANQGFLLIRDCSPWCYAHHRIHSLQLHGALGEQDSYVDVVDHLGEGGSGVVLNVEGCCFLVPHPPSLFPIALLCQVSTEWALHCTTFVRGRSVPIVPKRGIFDAVGPHGRHCTVFHVTIVCGSPLVAGMVLVSRGKEVVRPGSGWSVMGRVVGGTRAVASGRWLWAFLLEHVVVPGGGGYVGGGWLWGGGTAVEEEWLWGGHGCWGGQGGEGGRGCGAHTYGTIVLRPEIKPKRRLPNGPNRNGTATAKGPRHRAQHPHCTVLLHVPPPLPSPQWTSPHPLCTAFLG